MTQKDIISKVNTLLHDVAEKLAAWLSRMLPHVSKNWWQENVVENLTLSQENFAREKGMTRLEDLDLAMLLRVTDRSWYAMRSIAYLPTSARDAVRAMIKVRNNWAHCSVDIPPKEVIIEDVLVIKKFFEEVIATDVYSRDIDAFLRDETEKTTAELAKSGTIFNVSTNAELLNELFDKNYKSWMKCTYPLTDTCFLWMVAIDGQNRSDWVDIWKNGEIHERYVGSLSTIPTNAQDGMIYKRRAVFEKVNAGHRKYFVFRGVFELVENQSRLSYRILRKISDTTNLKDY